MSQTPVAILTGNPRKYSETFVRRHIAELNGGATVTVALSLDEADAGDDRLLACAPVRVIPPRKRWRKPLAAWRGDRAARQRDARIAGFLDRHRASPALCEFGYVATEVAPGLLDQGRSTFCYFRGNDASARLSDPDYRAALAEILPRIDGIVAVSRFLLDRLAAHGLQARRSLVVPSGTDTRLIMPGEVDPDLVLVVGRLVAKKDPLAALEIFAAGAPATARLEFVGDGPLAEALTTRAAELGLSDRVVLHGALPHDAVIARLRRAACVLQPFRTAADGDTEGMPSIVQEAMAAGVAVVTTAHAGVPEHVRHEETGLVHPEGATEALAESLARVLTDADLRARLGTAARRYAEAELDYRILYRRLESFMGLGA
ncbi:glycosyltransferase [Litorisediminicola beolgyonensis]|uniref:Glycosyltransferase n=1 Tax=Litorisediminicola beolgyonensis TaxID=1173614 RepID=A0ABW3ZD39_9RHOB